MTISCALIVRMDYVVNDVIIQHFLSQLQCPIADSSIIKYHMKTLPTAAAVPKLGQQRTKYLLIFVIIVVYVQKHVRYKIYLDFYLQFHIPLLTIHF